MIHRFCLLAMGLLASTALPVGATPPIESAADTIVLRPPKGGVWRTPQTAMQRMRLTGGTTDSDFGELHDVLALRDGGAVVFDASGDRGPELMVFDSTGRLARRLGRRGAGPGEFGTRANLGGLAEGPNGEIWLFDQANSRIDRWAKNGTVLAAVTPRVTIGPILNIPLFAGPRGSIYVPAQVIRDSKMPMGLHLHGLFKFSTDGEVLDTIRAPLAIPTTRPSSIYTPQVLFHPLADGGMVSVLTDRASVIIAPGANGTVLRTELPITAAPFHRSERAELLALAEFQAKQMKMAVADVPAQKPIFARIQVGGDGRRLWLQHPSTGRVFPEWLRMNLGPGAPALTYGEFTRFLVLATDGTWLGEMGFAEPGIVKVSFSGRTAWGIIRLPDGGQALVQWSLPK